MRALKTSLFAMAFAGIFLLTSHAQAHFMWVNAHDYTPKADQTARFTVGWGHAFYNPVGDILEGVDTLGRINMLESGVWVLKANHKAPYPKLEEADEYSYTTSPTFEVR